jgi:hypothetical protein
VALDPVVDTSDVDLWSVPAKNQLRTQSCVGNAGAAGLRRAFERAGVPCPELSARYCYRACLNIDGTEADDGTYLRSAARALMGIGCCAESAMPFDESEILSPISFGAHRDAFDRRRLGSYHRIASGDVDGICRALAAGLPVMAGWQVSEDFVRSTGHEVFGAQLEPITGGHAMLLVGHGSSAHWEQRVPEFRPNRSYSRIFRVLGSWGGSPYGYDGRIFMAPEMAAQASDLWALDTTGGIS